MSREIKFRVWDKHAEKMGKVTGISFSNVQYNLVHYRYVDGRGKIIDEQSHIDDKGHGVIALMQFTGLKDKNGHEIYEGDILEAEHKLKTQKFKRKYQVIFNEKGYWDAISLDDKPVRLCYAGFDKCEVIGNIFKNQELLESH